MCLIPVGAHTDFGKQGHFQGSHTRHQTRYFHAQPFHLRLRDFEDQFIVDLHDHFGGALLSIQDVLDLDHTELDEIGRRTLHRCVDGGALGTGAALAVGGLDLRQVQAPSETVST